MKEKNDKNATAYETCLSHYFAFPEILAFHLPVSAVVAAVALETLKH